MKKRTGIAVIVPIVMTVSMYLVFYDKIASKPSDAGFWFIFIMGMSFGVALCRLLLNKVKK